MKGRKRKPDHLKVVAGTDQRCRVNDAAPAAPKSLPQPSDWLSTRATEIFHGLVATLDEMGIASSADTAVIAMAASRLEEVEITTALVEDNGRTYTTVNESGAEMVRARPEVAQRSDAMKHAQSLLGEMGLTPAARSKVSVTKRNEENPFKALGA